MILLHLLKYVFHAKQEARLSKQQIKNLQIAKFRKLVQFVSQKSPYYRDIIKKYRIDINNCKPEDFPVLTKADVIEHFDRIVTDPRITKEKISRFLEESKNSNDLFLNKYYVIHTSGSSGTIGYYIYTQKEIMIGLSPLLLIGALQFFQRFGYIAAAKGHFAGITMANMAKRFPLFYRKVETFDINLPFDTIIDGLNKLNPTTVGGYAFALKRLAEAQAEGKLHIRPRLLQSGGEPLSEKDKRYIETIFKVPVTNVYAASEHMVLGVGTDVFGGMYLMENNCIFEIKQRATYVTNVYNYTLPLIRYQMTDRLEKIEDITHTLPFTKVAAIAGRNEHIPIFINDSGKEDFIHTSLIAEIYVRHVKQFQMHILSKKQFEFYICLEKSLQKREIEQTIQTIRQTLQHILDEKNMTQVTFSVKQVEHLWADPKTGKFRIIVKE